MVSWQKRSAFRDILNDDSEITNRLDAAKLDELFDYDYYTQYVDESFQRLGLG